MSCIWLSCLLSLLSLSTALRCPVNTVNWAGVVRMPDDGRSVVLDKRQTAAYEWWVNGRGENYLTYDQEATDFFYGDLGEHNLIVAAATLRFDQVVVVTDDYMYHIFDNNGFVSSDPLTAGSRLPRNGFSVNHVVYLFQQNGQYLTRNLIDPPHKMVTQEPEAIASMFENKQASDVKFAVAVNDIPYTALSYSGIQGDHVLTFDRTNRYTPFVQQPHQNFLRYFSGYHEAGKLVINC